MGQMQSLMNREVLFLDTNRTLIPRHKPETQGSVQRGESDYPRMIICDIEVILDKKIFVPFFSIFRSKILSFGMLLSKLIPWGCHPGMEINCSGISGPLLMNYTQTQ